MNENIDLTKILKDCPIGTKLYSTIHGEVSLISSNAGLSYPIVVRLSDNTEESFTAKGKISVYYDGECILFPSREQRDWSKFTSSWYKKEKFDPKTLKPFDKVLIRDRLKGKWSCSLFSHIDNELQYHNVCTNGLEWKFCIPYNEETKHLVGTTEEAPEFYRYWEE